MARSEERETMFLDVVQELGPGGCQSLWAALDRADKLALRGTSRCGVQACERKACHLHPTLFLRGISISPPSSPSGLTLYPPYPPPPPKPAHTSLACPHAPPRTPLNHCSTAGHPGP